VAFKFTSAQAPKLGPQPKLPVSNNVRTPRESIVQNTPSYSRRALSRLPASEDVWVCWRCNGRDDVSRVLDISVDGLFIQTAQPTLEEGMAAKVDFLVQEGPIRADAVIRHIRPGAGLGARLLAVADQDRTRLKALLSRLRASAIRKNRSPFEQFEKE
jgi:hypothetical protein